MSSVNMNTLLSSRLNRQIAPLKLSRPAVLGDHVVVATEDPDEKEHFLMIVDTKVMSDTKADPLVKWCQPTQVRLFMRLFIRVYAFVYTRVYTCLYDCLFFAY